MDVVPAGDKSRWHFDPYCGRIEGGRILGRGAADMKGGLSSLLFVFTAVHELNIPLSGSLIFVSVGDEEAGVRGSKFILDHVKLRADGCVMGEPSSPFYIVIGSKGDCWLRLKAKGKPAHGSVPMLGENAISKMMNVLRLIEKISEIKFEPPGDILDVIENSKMLLSTFGLKLEKLLDHCAVNVGTIKGGTMINIVPDECIAEVCFTVPIGVTSDDIKNLVFEILNQNGFQDVECEAILETNPNYTHPTERIAECVIKNSSDILGIKPKPIFQLASADDLFYRERGIPTVIYGPGSLKDAHSYNESVGIEELLSVAKVYAGTVVDFLS